MDLQAEKIIEYDFYDALPEHVKTGIERGIDDMNNGRIRDHESVMHEIRIKYNLKS